MVRFRSAHPAWTPSSTALMFSTQLDRALHSSTSSTLVSSCMAALPYTNHGHNRTGSDTPCPVINEHDSTEPGGGVDMGSPKDMWELLARKMRDKDSAVRQKQPDVTLIV